MRRGIEALVTIESQPELAVQAWLAGRVPPVGRQTSGEAVEADLVAVRVAQPRPYVPRRPLALVPALREIAGPSSRASLS
jgi:hypothetical protein